MTNYPIIRLNDFQIEKLKKADVILNKIDSQIEEIFDEKGFLCDNLIKRYNRVIKYKFKILES